MFSGCGSKPTLNGTVVIDGLTLPSGQLTINPDVNGGNDGPQAIALVEESKYEFIDGSEATPGKNTVTVTFSQTWLKSGGSDLNPPENTAIGTLTKDFDLPSEGEFNFEFESESKK